MSERIEIPAEKLHEEMLKLRQGKHMDFLRSLTGMDWGEEGLGVVYHLEDTNTRENIVVSTRTTNREKPELPSVSDIWKGAEFNEREVYDYYGIRFIGHFVSSNITFESNLEEIISITSSLYFNISHSIGQISIIS